MDENSPFEDDDNLINYDSKTQTFSSKNIDKDSKLSSSLSNENTENTRSVIKPLNIEYKQKTNKKKNKKKKNKPTFGWRIVYWFSIIIMVGALVALGVIVAGYAEGCMMYKEISEDVLTVDNDSSDLANMKVDWDKLLSINPETVGWVYIPGTQVNYPVVHTTDNEKYLKTTFRNYRSNVSFGTIFVDSEDSHDLSNANIVTYGHHMNDGSMYAKIATLKDSAEFNKNRNIYFLTPAGNYRLKSFSVVMTNGQDKIVQTSFSNKASMNNYIQDKINRSCVTPDSPIPDVNSIDKIFTFSTCDYFENDGRTILFAYVAESTVAGVNGLDVGRY